MKVYVDDNEDYRITYSSRDGSECLESMCMQPIIVESLSDYTKQVRKEVCEEIREQVLKHFNVKSEEEYEKSLSLLDALFTADVVFEILDQIQGE